LAEIGHLDRLTRDQSLTQRDYLRPAQPLPRAAAAPGETAASENTDNPEQRAQYDAPTRKTILELQPYRRTESATITGPGGKRGTATLINLNPNTNAWFLLKLDWGADGRATYHLENPDPAGQHIHLVEGQGGLSITTATASTPCDLWSAK